MLNAVSINTKSVRPVHIKIGRFNKAQAENTQNGYLSNITQSSLKDTADAIKNANEINTSKVNNTQENESVDYIKTKEEKLAEAKENLDAANKNSATKLIPTDGGMLSALCMLGVMFLLVSRLIIKVKPNEQGNG